MDPREFWRCEGRTVVRLRTERGWGRAKLAERAGVSKHTVGKVERGEPVFPSTLTLIAAALGVTAAELRVAAEAVPTIDPAKQRLLDVLSDRYALYREVVRRENAVRGGGMELLRKEFPKGLARSVRWTLACSRAVSFAGGFNTPEGTVDYFEGMFAAALPAELRVEEAGLFGTRGVITRGVEFVTIEGIGPVRSTWVHLHEFDRRRRLIRAHTSHDMVAIASLPTT